MIQTEIHDDVATITMCHGKVNAMSIEFCQAIANELQKLEHDNECRAIVLTGQGGTFSAGIDLVRMLDEDLDYYDRFMPSFCNMLENVFFFEKPIVGAINGHAIAGGFILACACDYRVMRDNSGRIGVPELRVGVPFPVIAFEIIRFFVARQYFQSLVTGGATFESNAAVARGFVEESAGESDFMDRAKAVAAQYAAFPEDVFSLTKWQTRGPVRTRIENGQREFSEKIDRMWRSSEIREEIRRYMNRTFRKHSADAS